MKRALKVIFDIAVFSVSLLMLIYSFGCTKKVYLPTETIKESHIITADTTQSERVRELIDQLQNTVRTQEKVIVRDSVIYVVNEAGETVSKEVYRSHDRDYSENEITQRVTQIYDSLFQKQSQRVDSILNTFKQEPVVVEVEKKQSLWQRIIDIATSVLILAFFIGIFSLYRKIKSKYFH